MESEMGGERASLSLAQCPVFGPPSKTCWEGAGSFPAPSTGHFFSAGWLPHANQKTTFIMIIKTTRNKTVMMPPARMKSETQ